MARGKSQDARYEFHAGTVSTPTQTAGTLYVYLEVPYVGKTESKDFTFFIQSTTGTTFDSSRKAWKVPIADWPKAEALVKKVLKVAVVNKFTPPPPPPRQSNQSYSSRSSYTPPPPPPPKIDRAAFEAQRAKWREANRPKARPTEPDMTEVFCSMTGLDRSALNLESAKRAYRIATRKYHPDLGGDTKKMAELNVAWTQLQSRLS